jgi:hypothetical protein
MVAEMALKDPAAGSYSSTLAVATPKACPPAMSVRPSGRREAVAPDRGMLMLPASLQWPVADSKTSAEASVAPSGEVPPATRTPPSAWVTHMCPVRAANIGATAVNVLSALYTSALASGPRSSEPPAISTRPSGSCAAQAPSRATDSGL